MVAAVLSARSSSARSPPLRERKRDECAFYLARPESFRATARPSCRRALPRSAWTAPSRSIASVRLGHVGFALNCNAVPDRGTLFSLEPSAAASGAPLLFEGARPLKNLLPLRLAQALAIFPGRWQPRSPNLPRSLCGQDVAPRPPVRLVAPCRFRVTPQPRDGRIGILIINYDDPRYADGREQHLGVLTYGFGCW